MIRPVKKWKNIFVILFLMTGAGLFGQEQQQCELLEIFPSEPQINCLNTCVTLKASLMPGVLNETTEYTIEANLPCPLPPADNGTPTDIETDDEWSELIEVPFTFSFLGQLRDSLIIGDNGVVAFDYHHYTDDGYPVQAADTFCAWSFDDRLPSPNLFRSTIFGAYHDLYIEAGGAITYYVSGQYPNRKFVIYFNDVAQFSCHELHTTQRIILYETSNAIDVQITRKPVCETWNDGNAVIGIQNQDGTVAYVPPGRNTGAWEAENELWRFIPSGPRNDVQVEYKWYDSDDQLVSTADTLQVCNTTTESYRVEVTLYRPTDTIRLTATTTVPADFSHDEVDLGEDQQICPGDTLYLDATTRYATAYHWYRDGQLLSGDTTAVYAASEPGTYYVEVEIGVCSTSDTIQITPRPVPQVELGPDLEVCETEQVILDATPANRTGNETYEWYKDNHLITDARGPQLEVTESGTYTVVVSEPQECTVSDSVHVNIQPKPQLDLGPDKILCAYQTGTVTANITDGDLYVWQINGDTLQTQGPEIQLEGPGRYHVVLTMTKNVCTVSDSVDITILDPLILSVEPQFYGILDVTASGGLPPYFYSLDNENFQESGHFEELPDGDYHVYVKDSNHCQADTIVHVVNLIFPPYFSPNNDGMNDTWRIKNAEYTPEAQLYIYDRYGRLLKNMHTSVDEFWDGTFNGSPLPSTDYWYVLVLPNGRVYKGHFSLLR